MNRSLLSIAMMVTATPVFAFSQSASGIVVAVPEPSTISLIVAGVVALGIARRKAEKVTKP